MKLEKTNKHKNYCKCSEEEFVGLRTITEKGKTIGTVCATCTLPIKEI